MAPARGSAPRTLGATGPRSVQTTGRYPRRLGGAAHGRPASAALTTWSPWPEDAAVETARNPLGSLSAPYEFLHGHVLCATTIDSNLAEFVPVQDDVVGLQKTKTVRK